MSAGSLAVHGAVGTIEGMTTKRRSPVVARFEMISNDPAAGEAYQHTVTVQKNGRVRSVVTCVGREETIQEWAADQPPTLEELADLLIAACHDNHHESRTRLLSAVVHGLLPQGNHLWEEAVEIPDAVLDASLGFGPRTTYRVELQKALVAVLRGKPSIAWGARIQSVGTDEREQFAQQLAAAVSADPEWLQRSLRASRRGEGTSYDHLVARAAPAAAKDHVATSEPLPDAPVTIYWDDYAGGSFSLVPSGWVEENISPLREVAQAKTWGDVRKIGKPFWLERLVEDRESDREDEGLATEDETPFQGADLGMDMGSFLDCMVAPWDLESLADWFPLWDWDIIERHCRTGGASPGGHIDVYEPEDRAVLLAALRSRGYRVEHRDFLDDLERALSKISA